MEGLGVEFLDGSAGDPAPARHRPSATRSVHLPVRADLAAAVLWTVAAVLCLVAVFLNLYTYRIDFSVIHTRGGYDALGHSLDKELAQDQGPRFAIILVGAAVIFALLAVAIVRDMTGSGSSRWRRYLPSIGAGGVALLAGVLACIALWLDSSFASYRSLVGPMADGQPNALHLAIGGCIWFGLGALGCGVAALIATFGYARAEARPDAPVDPHVI